MNSDYKWKILFKPAARDDLRKLPKNTQKRIADKMRFFTLSADILKFAKKLKESKYGTFRFRVGDYRIIFDVIDKKKEIFILKIAKRDKVYK